MMVRINTTYGCNLDRFCGEISSFGPADELPHPTRLETRIPDGDQENILFLERRERSRNRQYRNEGC